MKGSLTFLFLFFLVIESNAQEIKFTDPIRLPPQINTPYEEIGPLLTPDRQSLYFVRAFDPQNKGGRGAGMDIWVSAQDVKGNWLPPSNKLRWNNKLNNAVVGIKKDGKVIYLLNSYTNKSGVAFSKNLNGSWTAPEIIPMSGIEKLNLVGFFMNSNFDVLLISMVKDGSFGKEDLYVSLKDSLDRWGEPINLGATINTSGFEISPFLSDDGKKLYFASDGHKGYGDADILVSERLHNNWTLWTRPRNLGSKINSEKFDAYFSIYGDSVCYFSSNRSSDFSDIYKSKVSIAKRTLLKDSVNKIVDETKKLLNELKSGDEASDFEYIPSPLNSVILSNPMQNQIKKIIGTYDTKQIKLIEMTCYRLHPDQINNVIDYLVSLGVSKQNIKQPALVTTGTIQSGVELKISLGSKN
jgi:WD40-like Beta Propeller Repeat